MGGGRGYEAYERMAAFFWTAFSNWSMSLSGMYLGLKGFPISFLLGVCVCII